MSAATGAWIQERDEPAPRESEAESVTFEQFYDACLPPVYRFIFFYVQDRETAQDLSSDTFMKAWRLERKGPS